MHGLPGQTAEQALQDLTIGLQHQPTHLSWYQLTLEPNTVFAKYPPKLPREEALFEIQEQGHALLTQHNFNNYEVSAYCQTGKESQHNLNYWEFGDYLGIGAGAHSKITDINNQSITRLAKTRNPSDYLNKSKPFVASQRILSEEELPLEFMMNALRLTNGVPKNYFSERSGLNFAKIAKKLENLEQRGLLDLSGKNIKTTPLGRRFLNDCLAELLA
jgi:oxygen-independent coproporphyrinogen-3 oxidase